MSYHDAKATRILATHCVSCGKDLLDAKSVEIGMGPDCRRRFLRNPEIETTDEMRLRALGALAVSGLPTEIIDAVMAHKGDARVVCNTLVFHAALHFTDKEFVLGCTPVIRLLGYVKLADKLEKDRSTVKLTATDDGWIEVYVPRNETFMAGAHKMGGEIHRHPKGRFKCWAVPEDRKDSLVLLLGATFPNEYAFFDGEHYAIVPSTWSAFMASLPGARKPASDKVRYRRTRRGEWVVFGPADEVKPGTVTVTLKNGRQKTEVVESTGKPFEVEGVPHVYGYLAPKMPNAGTATTRWAS